MNKDELYQAVLRRMENFHISFDEAIKEIKEIYPDYKEILNEMVHPGKTKVEMDKKLWGAIETLMYIIETPDIPEEKIQRHLGVVSYLYRREFPQSLINPYI